MSEYDELQASEERLLAVLDSGPIGLAELDAHLVFRMVRGIMAQSAGAAANMIGRPLADVYPGRVEETAAATAALAGRPSSGIVEANGLRLELHYNPLRDREGDIYGVAIVAFDVTSSVVAEHRLSISETRLNKKEAQQAALIDIGARALRGADPQDLMLAAVTGAARVLAADLAGVLEVIAGDGELALRATHGAPASLPTGSRVAMTPRNAASRAITEGRTVVVADYDAEGDFELHPNLAASGIRSSLCVPIPGSSAALGVLTFHSRREGAWDNDDARFAEQLASLLSVTLLRIRMAAEAANEMQRQREFERAVFDNMTDMVAACDATGTITMFNRAMGNVVDHPPTPIPAEVWNTFWVHRYPDGTEVPFDDLPLNRALRGDPMANVEMVVIPKAGPRQLVVVNATSLSDADGRTIGAVVVKHDVTVQRDAESGLAFHTLHDALTGLPNRTLFVDHLRRALRRAGRHRWATALIAVNIDHFEAINARLGHSVGDEVLSEVAARLQASLRSYDSVSRELDTVARLGGDEFFILCEHVGGQRDAASVTDRIADVLAEPIPAGGEAVRITARMGITVTSDAERDPETLILEANAAVRRARDGGPGTREFFAEEMRVAQLRRIDDERALRAAVAEGQLRLVFQPKISLSTDLIVGVEALLRWEHPERGLIPPSEFIPLAEETGLIVAMGEWVLLQACEQGIRWQQRRTDMPPLTVSVNVSGRQFESGLVEMFMRAVADTGIQPAILCLEVTESIVMRDAEFAIETLQKLRALGVKISIDDFGTGYSSLAYLRRFPLNELKVDKSFVDGLGRDPEATAIVAAVMGMAHALDLNVVAEGVETELQLNALRGLGCDQAQGYYYARPLPVRDIDALLEAGPLRGDRIAPTGAAAVRERGAGTVVVVDDAADVRLLARVSLTAAGFGVHEAESGEGAIDLIRRVRPDCVVLDMHMPGIGGLDVCRALRSSPDTRDTTIVMVTAEGQASEKAEAFSLEVDDYIVKPFAPRDLVSRVTAAIRRRAAAARRATPPQPRPATRQQQR